MTLPDDTNAPGYDVGYGKPPVASRFRKGRSGNTRGKSPGRKNLKTELLDELTLRITVSENGKQRQLSKQTIIVKRMVSDAAKGDARAREQLIRLIGEIEATPQASASDPVGAAKDAEILARFKTDLISNIREGTA